MTPAQAAEAEGTLEVVFGLIGHLPAVPPAIAARRGMPGAHLPGFPQRPNPHGVMRARAMEARRALAYPCALCGDPSQVAAISEVSDLVPYAGWLDACHPCFARLRRLAAAVDGGYLDVDTWPPAHGDAAIIIRYERWQAQQ